MSVFYLLSDHIIAALEQRGTFPLSILPVTKTAEHPFVAVTRRKFSDGIIYSKAQVNDCNLLHYLGAEQGAEIPSASSNDYRKGNETNCGNEPPSRPRLPPGGVTMHGRNATGRARRYGRSARTY
jgi:hypothetical protein